MSLPVKKSASSVNPTAVQTITPTKPVTVSTKTAPLMPAERMKMIAEAAYFIAEKHNFSHGRELTDWVAAEKQVDALTHSVGNKRSG